MSVRSDVLLWAQRILGKKTAPAHQLLEVPATASFDEVQTAFHKIAKMAHPDLHRSLSADDLEVVTLAYSKCAGAYQELRSQLTGKARPAIEPLKVSQTVPIPTAHGADKAVAVPSSASAMMSSKALVHYRKAELSLRRGDIRAALLQLKMAIASDPSSAFLRTALTEVEAEVTKKP
jgi:hypothetical protein